MIASRTDDGHHFMFFQRWHELREGGFNLGYCAFKDCRHPSKFPEEIFCCCVIWPGQGQSQPHEGAVRTTPLGALE